MASILGLSLLLLAAAPPEAPVAPSGVVAHIGTASISASELEAAAQDQLFAVRSQEYDIKKQALEALIERKLLESEAGARGLSVGALMQAEITEKTRPATEEETKAEYDSNRPRYAALGEDGLVAAEAIVRQRNAAERRSAFLAELRSQRGVTLFLEPPRTSINVPNAASIGPADAPVTIIEFSDFQCPYCARVFPTLQSVRAHYGDRVRLVYAQFPLQFHGRAEKAAEASLCALEQERFWDFSDRVFKDQSKLDVSDLKGLARDLRLEGSDFDSCLDSSRQAAHVAAQIAEGRRLGVSGTPTFFVNGRLVGGTPSFEGFRQLIDEELVAPRRRNGSAQLKPMPTEVHGFKD